MIAAPAAPAPPRWLAAAAWWIVLVVSALLVVAAARTQAPDDGYIVWRFVQNLVAGHGWSFNPGEPVNGSTSPLQVMLLALPCWLCSMDVRDANAGLAVVALVVTGGTFAAALVRLLVPVWLSRLCALGLVWLPLHRVTFGLECQLQLAGVGAFWLAWLHKRLQLAGLLAGFAVLARPDCVLVLLALVLPTCRQVPRRQLLVCAAASAAVLLPWCVWSWLQFGELLPSTLTAKMAQGQSGLWQVERFAHELRHSLARFDSFAVFGSYKPFFAVAVVGAAAALMGGVGGAFVVAAMVHAAAYVWLRVPFFHWYALLLHVAVVLTPAMLYSVLSRRRSPRAVLGLPGLLAGLMLVSSTRLWFADGRSSGYHEAASWLSQNTNPGAAVACYEIGQIGFGAARNRVVDLAGLVTGRAVPHLRRAEFTWVLEQRPELFVLHEPPWPRLESDIVADARFAEYGVAARFADGVVVYAR